MMKRFLIYLGLTIIGGLTATGISAAVTVSGNLFGGYHFSIHGFPFWYLNFYQPDLLSNGTYFNFTNAVLDFLVWSFASLFLIFAFSELASYLQERGRKEKERIQSVVH